MTLRDKQIRAKQIVTKIFNDLSEREEFEKVFDELDEDEEDDMKKEWERLIIASLPSGKDEEENEKAKRT